MAGGASRHILVVGDFIVDRTWLVTDLPLPKRLESHYHVVPSTLVNPDNRTDVAGGVGTIARSIAATSKVRITVAGGWSDDVQPAELLPPDAKDIRSRIAFVRIASASFTTLKSRVFVSEPSGPVLRARYDRNLRKGDLHEEPADLPPRGKVSAVIVSDYDYGLFDDDKIDMVSKLEQYSGLPFLLRSPHIDLIQRLPWTLLAINLPNLSSILGHREDFDKPVVRQVGGRCIYHPDFVSALDEVQKLLLKPGRVVLVRISRDAAVLLRQGQLAPITLSIAHDEPDGVGSGDVVLAQTALKLIARTPVAEAATKAFAAAAIFSAGARRLEETKMKGWYTPRFDLELGKTSVSIVEASSASLKSLADERHNAQVYEDLLKGPIRLHDAEWYLPGFLTVNQKFGREIVSLKSQIKAYIEQWRDPSIADHPFLAALCGEPGAGKSTLARAMARVVGCEVVSESAAQWTTPEDLFWLCERIRSIRMRKNFPLAFIDEVDADVNGEKLYGKLLAPVWDGAYFIRGEERTLGATIFLLAGSTRHWQQRDALLQASDARSNAGDKLPDLVSRLTANPIEIPALKDRKADAVYLAAYSFIRRFPRVRGIARGILTMLADSDSQHGSRSITRVVDLFGPLANDDCVMPDDLQPNRYDELRLHIPRPRAGWEKDKDLVPVEI